MVRSVFSSSLQLRLRQCSLVLRHRSTANNFPGLDLQGNTYWEFRDTLNPGRMRRIVQYPPSTQYSEVTSKITPAWHQWLRHIRESPPSLTEQAQDLTRQAQLKVLAAQADARWNAKESFLDSPKAQQQQPMLGQGMGPPNPRAPPPVEKQEIGATESVPSPAQASKAQRQKMADTTVAKIGPLDRDPERMRVPEGPKAQVFRNPGVGTAAEGAAKSQAEEIAEAQGESEKEPLQPRQVKEEEKKKKEDPWEMAKKAQGTARGTEWQPKAWTPPAAAPRR